MRRFLRILWFVTLFGVVFIVLYVHIPYYAEGPGPAHEVAPLIDIHGHPRYGSAGKLIMTTVRFFQLTPVQAVQAWLDPHEKVVPAETLYPGGEDPATEHQRAISQMDQSKIDAAVVALTAAAGYPKRHGDGALIEFVGPRCPADGKLYPGDVVEAIDGRPVASEKVAGHLIGAAKPGDPMTFKITAAGQTHQVTVAKGTCPGSDDPLVGVTLENTFPFPVTISSDDIGGPSAGLMFSLGLYDALTPGDLTAGRTVAGTGTIDTQGNVGPIGGITDKVVAAEGVGAQMFLVPKDNMVELDGVDTGSMKLIPVGTFQEALDALRSGARSPHGMR